MSHLGNLDRLRLRLNFADSPAYGSDSDSGPGLSPMTHITLNLGDTNLSTPRRKLSLPDNENTPLTHRSKSLLADKRSEYIMETSPLLENRLLKNVIKLPVGAGGQGGGRGRSLARRINMSPLQAMSPLSNKENLEDAPPSDDAALAGGGDGGGGGGGGGGPFGSPQKPPSPPAASPSPGRPTTISPSKFQFVSPLRMRQPLEDHDPNSQDSGYSPICCDKDGARSGFRFTEPVGMAPRRQLVEQSPGKEFLIGSPRSRSSGYGSPPFFRSFSSGSGSGHEGSDDGFGELMDSDKLNEDSQFPLGMNSLLSGTLKEQSALWKEPPLPEVQIRPSFRRHLSLVEPSSRIPRAPLRVTDDTNNISRIFKRPDPPFEPSQVMQTLKRPKFNPLCHIPENKEQLKIDMKIPSPVMTFATENIIAKPKLQRSFSESEATIKRALQRSSQEPDLIGDFSKPFVLPLIEGRHQDLKTISADTLASLLRGQYSDTIESFTIIDCRYPYEYEGGHIRGSCNIYTQDQIYKEFVDKCKAQPESTGKRNILIFHCEFSSERGPKLSRYLRNSDRVLNKESYPALHYPEVYLLHGGYKEFFEKYSDLCEPSSYCPMLHPNYEADLRHFRAKTKSGSAIDGKTRLALRSNLKRLGL